MSETGNIGEIAPKLSKEIFKHFLWDKHQKHDDNVECKNSDHKSDGKRGASKNGILIDQLNILENVPYKIDSASYDFVQEGVRGQLTFATNGSVKLSGALTSKILHLIELDLPTYI